MKKIEKVQEKRKEIAKNRNVPESCIVWMGQNKFNKKLDNFLINCHGVEIFTSL